MIQTGGLHLNRLRVLQKGVAVYDEKFHEGINIIRGLNGSGKSTIADFIFFILGGEFDEWKDAAKQCQEVQAEVETTRGRLTLRRTIESKTQPIEVYFGPMADANQHALEGWERFPLRRQGKRESFSQVMFRSLMIPEAKSEGASNITMHQLLRLCYSDQRSPAARLFRFESFDTQAIREAVGDLICGISGYDIYEIGLTLRDKQKDLAAIEADLSGLLRALPPDEAFRTPQLINTAIKSLSSEKTELQRELEQVDDEINSGEVKGFLKDRRSSQAAVTRERAKIEAIELDIEKLEMELREVREFQFFLNDLMEKLALAEDAFEAVGSIEFTHCPACGAELEDDTPAEHCIVCKCPTNPDQEQSRYNQIRLDLEIQTRETKQLVTQKDRELGSARNQLRRARGAHERTLAEFDMKFAGANGPREAYLAERTNRIGHIDAEIEYLTRSLDIADEIDGLQDRKRKLKGDIDDLKERERELQTQAGKRRRIALSQVSEIGASILRADFKRQEEFETAQSVEVKFWDDAISVDGRLNFAESSNVFLKNTAVFSIFLAACQDPNFFHPRFLLFDNIEDKGMEEARSHLFQKLIVEISTELEVPFQVIFTTSMMNPELELDDYTIGPAYTKEHKTLSLENPAELDVAVADTPLVGEVKVDDSVSLLESSEVDDELDAAQTMTPVGTRLDLARAYVDMGNPDGARSILEELISEGDDEEKERAAVLLKDLSA